MARLGEIGHAVDHAAPGSPLASLGQPPRHHARSRCLYNRRQGTVEKPNLPDSEDMFSAVMLHEIGRIDELVAIVTHCKSVYIKSEFLQGIDIDLASDETVGGLRIGVDDVGDLQVPSPVGPMIDIVPPSRAMLVIPPYD
ncbi:hypothetical protein [Mesorhizobium sp. AR10]|uniref:hypothetical protein n=1 Tax=Mesorhizobium sp. AR10 TaxID=2865839 RepID=UPI00215DEA30|nr:hypothetical protein [Mesorhizobium sp. AR10]